MNDRVEELAEQAGYKEGFRFQMDDFNMYKFAELIIQECIKMIEATTVPEVENMDSEYARWWEGYDDRGADCIENIIEHFGINNETN